MNLILALVLPEKLKIDQQLWRNMIIKMNSLSALNRVILPPTLNPQELGRGIIDDFFIFFLLREGERGDNELRLLLS